LTVRGITTAWELILKVKGVCVNSVGILGFFRWGKEGLLR